MNYATLTKEQRDKLKALRVEKAQREGAKNRRAAVRLQNPRNR